MLSYRLRPTLGYIMFTGTEASICSNAGKAARACKIDKTESSTRLNNCETGRTQ
jgi:hypothetical protein